MTDGVWYLLLAHFVLWFGVTVYLIFDKYTDRKKAFLQSVFAFGIPLVGSGIVLAVNIGFRMKAKKPPEREMGQSIDEHLRKFGTSHLP